MITSTSTEFQHSPRLENRHAVITGAGGGIGAAVTAAYLREGARCTVVDLSPEPSLEVRELAAKYPDQLCYVAANVTSSEDRGRIVAQ